MGVGVVVFGVVVVVVARGCGCCRVVVVGRCRLVVVVVVVVVGGWHVVVGAGKGMGGWMGAGKRGSSRAEGSAQCGAEFEFVRSSTTCRTE